MYTNVDIHTHMYKHAYIHEEIEFPEMCTSSRSGNSLMYYM